MWRSDVHIEFTIQSFASGVQVLHAGNLNINLCQGLVPRRVACPDTFAFGE